MGIMKISVRFTSKQEHWKTVGDTAQKHGVTILMIGKTAGMTEWIGEIEGDIADISNFTNELGIVGVEATASIPAVNDDDL
jgi:hypothetical protein